MINKYEFTSTNINGLFVIDPFYASDYRGFVKKTFEKNIFSEQGILFDPIEEMETTSSKGVIRGLHFQTSYSQAKLIRCARGSILDVAVDLRKDSLTFSKYYSTILSAENRKMMFIPKGFAHGCLSLEDNTTFYYLSDSKYYPEYDGGIAWNDDDLSVDWEFNTEKIILSEKDENLPSFKDFLLKYGSISND